MFTQVYRRFFFMMVLFSLIGVCSPGTHAARFLFDASCVPMAGDADWVIDADRFPALGGQSDPQRFPSPDQCTVHSGTDEEYWTGGFSAWGIDLVKAGHWVETIPRNSTITFGNCSNSQDLSFYDVLIIPEPQILYTESEAEAIRSFVYAGGGLFMVANHCGSDRNNNGYDSPTIFEQLGSIEYFGIEFEHDADGEIHDYCDWDELNNRNFIDDPDDPFIHGPFGDVRAIGFHSATNLVLHSEQNASVKAHAWRNSYPHADTYVTVASCSYGQGRVVAIGDSAPADDGSGDLRDVLMNGWTHSTTNNNYLFLNMSDWLTKPDLPPLPTRTPCPNSTPFPKCDDTPTPGVSTPTPTPTIPGPQDPIVSIYTNKFLYAAGDPFELVLDIENPGAGRFVDKYILLEVSDSFWFYPTWTQDLNFVHMYINQDYAISETVFSFTWPEAGRIQEIIFWAALLDPSTNTLVGNYDFTSFGSY